MSADAKQFYPVCIGGKGATPPEHCRSPWAYMEMMDDYRHPPLDAMLVAAEAVRAVLDTDPQSFVREAIGDMEALRDAVEQLRDYHEFKPHKINRRRINAQLRDHAQRVGGEP